MVPQPGVPSGLLGHQPEEQLTVSHFWMVVSPTVWKPSQLTENQKRGQHVQQRAAKHDGQNQECDCSSG
jgi:hypothetical protein